MALPPGEIVKTPFAARKTPAVFSTPLGGEAMTVIFPPFGNFCLPASSKETDWLVTLVTENPIGWAFWSFFLLACFLRTTISTA